MYLEKINRKIYSKMAILVGSAHIDAGLERAESYQRPFQLVAILPCQIATSDPTWPGQIASDQNKRSLVQRPSVLIASCLPRPRRIRRGKLMWQNCDQMKRSLIRISPVQFGVLHWPSPTIQPFMIIIFA